MSWEDVLVTGGCGFIGSHLVETFLSRGRRVRVFDSLVARPGLCLKNWDRDPNFTLIRGNLSRRQDFSKMGDSSPERVFHLAGNPEVRVGSANPLEHFRQNVLATQNLLEYLRKIPTAPTLVFTSTSAVYGEASVVPTPEDFSPLKPVSIYGASKLAAESLIVGYAHTYGMRAIIARLANIVGRGSNHGVVPEFIGKLRENPIELEVLGDGRQTKSYLYIKDCVDAILKLGEVDCNNVEIFNVGSEDQISVTQIAKVVAEEMGLHKVLLRYRDGIAGKGWIGDVRNMLLDITKLRSKGWVPRRGSEEAVRLATRELAATIREVSAVNV